MAARVASEVRSGRSPLHPIGGMPMEMLVAVPLALVALVWLANLGPGPAHHRARPSPRRATPRRPDTPTGH